MTWGAKRTIFHASRFPLETQFYNLFQHLYTHETAESPSAPTADHLHKFGSLSRFPPTMLSHKSFPAHTYETVACPSAPTANQLHFLPTRLFNRRHRARGNLGVEVVRQGLDEAALDGRLLRQQGQVSWRHLGCDFGAGSFVG